MYEFCIRDETMANPRSLVGPHLDELRAFAVVARALSFSRAAELLTLDREAVQHRITRLEQLLEAKLFVAHADKLQLTERGEDLVAALAAFETVSPINGDAADGFEIAATELSDDEWAEAKRLALDLIGADRLDTPQAHLAYVRERIRVALVRDVV